MKRKHLPVFTGCALLAVAACGQSASPVSELRVSENGRYFLREGKPFFWMGDTVWSIVNRYTPEEAEFYMGERRKQGFNVLNVMLIFNGGPGIVTPMADAQGELPFVDMNPATPNDRYFLNVDRIVSLAREKGFTLAVAACGGSSGSFVNKQKVITAANGWAPLRRQPISCPDVGCVAPRGPCDANGEFGRE